jgi:hypothetical protein
LQPLQGCIVLGVTRGEVGPHLLHSGGLLLQAHTQLAHGVTLGGELLLGRLQPLPQLFPLARIRGDPGLKRLRLAPPAIAFGADGFYISCFGSFGFELGLDHTGLLSEPVTLGLTASELLS